MHNAILPPNPMEELERNKIIAEREQPTKKERKMLRRRQKKEEQGKTKQKRKIKKLFGVGLTVFIIGAGIVGFFLYFTSKPPVPESNIITKNGLHWHPEIKITILGKTQEIPANIGIGVTHKPIHTHDDTGVIHLEFQGFVKKDDIRLGNFFENWGKQFNKNCIFDKCSNQKGQLKMFVNGKENSDFENYVMRDGDKIAIIFE